jgi:hypothetical protein
VRKARHAGKILLIDLKRLVAELMPFTGEEEGRKFTERPPGKRSLRLAETAA